jgi:peptidoglycan/xylan/chitin deacetylase (PgdA/CDA1 family)
MYFINVPKIVQILKKDLIWKIPVKEKKIYLTFDDGPDQEITPKVLDILDTYKCKATFFCTGSKVQKNPDLIPEILAMGHSIGNHSYSHLNGSKTSTVLYLADVAECTEILSTKLFRPPYGRLTSQQTKELKKNYHIIMWSVLPGDFDERLSKQTCLKRAIKFTRKGSIIVFHDNKKGQDNMLYTLPRFIEHFRDSGYTFESVTEQLIDQIKAGRK